MKFKEEDITYPFRGMKANEEDITSTAIPAEDKPAFLVILNAVK